jgi:hypothetical protein
VVKRLPPDLRPAEIIFILERVFIGSGALFFNNDTVSANRSLGFDFAFFGAGIFFAFLVLGAFGMTKRGFGRVVPTGLYPRKRLLIELINPILCYF